MPTPTISSTSVEKVAIAKYAKTTQISTDLVTKHSSSAADNNCDNLVHLDETLQASDVLTLANGSRPLPVPTPTNTSGYTPTIVTPATFDGKPMSSMRMIYSDTTRKTRYLCSSSNGSLIRICHIIFSRLSMQTKHPIPIQRFWISLRVINTFISRVQEWHQIISDSQRMWKWTSSL